jgi:tetratricopeptide (TPR) repeat protein
VFAQVFYEALLGSTGEVDMAALVSTARRTLRHMSASDGARRVRLLAAKADRPATRFALEAEAARIERAGVPPLADPLHWAAFHVIGSGRLLVGGDEPALSNVGSTRRVEPPPGPAPSPVRPLIEPLPEETPEASQENSRDVTDLWVTVAQASKDPLLVSQAVSRLHDRVQRHLKRQRIDAAKADRDRLIALSPDRAEAHDAAGAIALAEGDVAAAVASLDRAVALEPGLVSARRSRAAAALAQFNPAAAVEDCTAALERRPDDGELLALRGMAFMAGARPLDALADFIAAIQADPDRPDAYVGKATVLLSLQRAQQAVEVLDEGIARCPEAAALYLQHAAATAPLGQIDRCLQDCDAAILLLPDPALGYTQKGYFLAACGELDRALEEFDRALAANAGLAQIYFSRACALSMNENPGTMVEDLRTAIAAQPQFRLLAIMTPELEWARTNVEEVRRLLG